MANSMTRANAWTHQCVVPKAQQWAGCELPRKEWKRSTFWIRFCSKKKIYFWCGPFLKSLLICYNIVFVSWVFWPWGMWVLSSPSRNRIQTPCVRSWSPSHWTTRDVMQTRFWCDERRQRRKRPWKSCSSSDVRRPGHKTGGVVLP